MIATTRPNAALLGIDGIRAIAFGAVFVSNMRHIVPMRGNFYGLSLDCFVESGVGVAIFFVLSGYLLTFRFWQAPEKWLQRQKSTFFVRRAARLLPAYLLCLLTLVIFQQHWQSPQERWDVFLHLVTLHNFTEFSFYSISDPFWTIPVQMQFYLLMPFIVACMACVCRSTSLAFLFLLFLSLASYGLQCVVMLVAASMQTWPFDPSIVQRNGFVLAKSTLAHLPIFLIGMAAGYLYWDPGKIRSQRRLYPLALGIAFWASAVAVVSIVTTSLEADLTPPFSRYCYPLLPCLIAAALLCLNHSGIIGLLEVPPMRWLGKISYGMYIFHFPCLKLVLSAYRHILSDEPNPMTLGVCGFAISIAVATAAYVLIEQPVIRIFSKSPL